MGVRERLRICEPMRYRLGREHLGDQSFEPRIGEGPLPRQRSVSATRGLVRWVTRHVVSGQSRAAGHKRCGGCVELRIERVEQDRLHHTDPFEHQSFIRGARSKAAECSQPMPWLDRPGPVLPENNERDVMRY